jgi:hypothetical protein
MARNRFLTESMIQDIGMQMVDNTYQALLDLGYEEHEIDNIVTRDSIEFDITNGSCVLYCGNETIFEGSSDTLLHKCIEEAEEALLNWCIKKIGREPDYIDADDLFQDVPGWNNTNENKNYNNMKGKNTIKFTESELKTMITECVKTILKEHMEMPGDNGGYFDTSERINSKKSTWRGVPGTTFIYHGEWSDPEIAYKGELLNYWDVEESLQYSYQADVESGDFEGSFDEWAEAQDPKYLASQLDEYIWAMQG